MGAHYNSTCYDSNAEAVSAYYSAMPVYFTSGATSYRSWYEQTAGVWQLKRQSIASNGTVTNLTTTNAPVPVFPVCDPAENFLDGMTVGWAIAAACIAVWSFNLMRRGLGVARL